MIYFPRLEGVYDHLIVHCTATPITLDIGTDWVDRVHRQQGWSGCGYHIVITRSGEIQWSGNGYRTKPIGQPGSHVGGCGPGWNVRSLGVTLVGGVKEDGRTPENNFTEAQYAALWEVIVEAHEAYGIPYANVMGHRDLIKRTNAAPKACPCFSVAEFMSQKPLSQTDQTRLSYNWNKTQRPAPQRGEKLVIKHTYIVKKDDNLWSISRTYGVPVKDIKALNGLADDHIKVGQKLKLLPE